MPDEIIDAEIEQLPSLRFPETAVTIMPAAVPGSVVPGFKARSYAPRKKFLFIGGPLDGRIINVAPDGRLYEHHTDANPQYATGLGDGPTYVYCPALISMKGQATAVYILEERTSYGEIPDDKGLGYDGEPERIGAPARRLT